MSHLTTIETIKNTNSAIRLITGDIFYVLYDKEIVISVSDFEETAKVYQRLSAGRKLKFMVEFPEFISATAEARKWAEEHQVDATAEAIVFSSLAQRMLIRFYLVLRKQDHPVKTFSNREMAIKWLNSFE